MKKRIGSLFLAMCMCLTMLPTAALADEGISVQAVTRKTVPYGIVDENTGKIMNNGNMRDSIVVDSTMTDWKSTLSVNDMNFYAVTGDVTIDGDVTIEGKATIILCDDATLTINGSLTIGRPLYIYGQYPSNTGELCINNYNNTGAAIKSNSNAWLYMQGGNLTVNGGIENVELKNGTRSNSYMKCTLNGKELLASEWDGDKFSSFNSLSIGWCNHNIKDIECISDDASTHHEHCKRCGFNWKSENHDTATVPTKDGQYHTSGCTKCNHTSNGRDAHIWDNITTGKCTVCGFKPVAVGDYDYAFSSVQAALDALVNGDTISAGLYFAVDSIKTIENQTIDFNYPGKTAELKMNGYSLNNSSITVRNGTLRITGNAINISNSSSTAINVTGGTLDMQGAVTLTGGLKLSGNAKFATPLKKGDVLNGGVSVGGSYNSVNELLSTGLAFATKSGETTTLVDGSGKTITGNVTVVEHTHSYTNNDACACGAVCPHSNIDDKTGECTTCKTTFAAAVNSTLYSDMATAISAWKNDGGTLKLYVNGGTVSFDNVSIKKPLSIDLNGHNINKDRTAINLNGVNLTIEDSREKESSQGAFGPIVADSGSLTLENGGYLQGLKVPAASTATVMLMGGKVNALECRKPVYTLLPDGYALMNGNLTIDPCGILTPGTQTYTIKNTQLKNITTTKSGNTTFGSQTIPFTLSLGTDDREIGKMSFEWYRIDRTTGATVEIARFTKDETPVESVYTFNPGHVDMNSNNWNDMTPGKYDVICVVIGKESDGAYCWQTALTGYTLTVGKAGIADADVQVANKTYNGNPQSPDVTVTLGGKTLELNKDYTISGNTGTNAGDYTLTITGMGNYGGEKTGAAWKINPAELTFTANAVSKQYDGTVTADADVTFTGLQKGETLTKGEDYTVTATYNTSLVCGGENQPVTGTVTLNNTDKAKNYVLSSNQISATGTITQANAVAGTTRVYIVNNLGKTYTVNLSEARPELGSGMVYGQYSFALDGILFDDGYYQSNTAEIDNDRLSIPIQAVDSKTEGKVGTIKVKLTSENFADSILTIELHAVNRMIPTGAPTLSKTAITYGEPLSTITLSGTMKDGNEDVAGTFTWANGTVKPNAGKPHATWIFTPNDIEKYVQTSGDVEITVNQATPTGEPKYTLITTSGKTLEDAKLTLLGSTLKPVAGSIVWIDENGKTLGNETKVEANKTYGWRFTPDDKNYTVLTGSIVLYRVSTGGGGGGSSTPTYTVNSSAKAENGSVTVNTKNAVKGSTVTITVKPDSGYVLDSLIVTDKNGSKLTVTDKGNGKYTFVMPAGKVDISASFAEQAESNPFGDVSADDYFHDAVKWAQEKGITGGIGGGLFGPDQSCTRAQIVTFLWRAAGSPEPKSASGFADIPTGSYYAKAVAWAVENGIANGMAADAFAPDASCTRAQSVTFLFRALGKLTSSKTAFTDVPAGSYYESAVAWATENDITNGIGGGLFGPDNGCTRAQIVTFLYRTYMGK